MHISIIIPARNEELLINATIKDILNYLKQEKQNSFEVLVIINGSQDKTERLTIDIQKNNSKVRILKSKAGYGFALREGLRKAKGDYIVIYNVDFYDFKLIDLIKIKLYGKDFIIGSKRSHWAKDSRNIIRKLVSTLFNNYLKIFLGFKGSDTHGIKVMKREVIDKIFKKCKTTSGIFDTELVLRAQREGFKLADFPVIVSEKRPTRFVNRLMQTPMDIYELTMSLIKEK